MKRLFSDFIFIAFILSVVFVLGIVFTTNATNLTNKEKEKPVVKLEPILRDSIKPWYEDIVVVQEDTLVPMFDSIIPQILHHEGSRFVHDKSINEVSRRGITLAAYKQHYGKGDYNSIKNLTEAQAKEIYKNLFWDKNNLDSIVAIGYPKTAAVLMDSEVNIGPYRANKYFQRHIGMVRSERKGVIDSTTLSYLRKSELTDEQLSKKILSTRRWFYASLVKKKPVFQKYHRGWNNRLDSMEDFIANI